MDKRTFFFNIHDEIPPPKKRRLHPPGFESSFHMNGSPSKPPRHTAVIQSSLSTTAQQCKGRERDGTPMRGLKPPRPALDASDAHAASHNKNSPAHHPHSNHKKRVSTSFSKFTPTFDLSPPPSTMKPRSDLPSSRIVRRISTPDSLRVREVETGSVGSIAIASRTPMHVLRPPSLREASQNYFLPKNHSPSSGRVSHLLGITSIADADKLKLSSMSSHLTSLQGAVSHLAPPKHIAVEVNRKLVPITPPRVAPDSPKGLNETTTMAIPSIVSYVERAEILANSVRGSRTHQPVNDELAELSRGLERSPQKGGRANGKKLIKGGLAERAERLLFRSSTNFLLWQAAFAKQVEGAKHPKEDIRLRVSSILSFTKNTTRSFSDGLPRTTIAKCTEVLQGISEGNESSPQERTVVFLFGNHEKVSSAVNFKVGKEVCIWRPWQEVELPEVCDGLHLPTLEVRTPPRSTTAIGRRTVLLCSRFLVSV